MKKTAKRQLANLRPGYKGKNAAGGRKCVMTTPKEYKTRAGVATPWSGSGMTFNQANGKA